MFKTMTGVMDLKKNPSADEINKIPSYVFCRWLSGSPYTVGAANQINYYFDIPMVNQYHMIKSAFGGKVKYIPYPKKESEDKLKQVEYIVDYFKISEEKAREYLDFISREELTQIVEMYEAK